MKSKLLLLLITLIQLSTYAQPACAPDNRSFVDGEKLHYTVSYNWGILWINAGEVNFDAKLTQFEHNSAYHFFSTGHSFKRWDLLFKVRDTFEVYSRFNDLQPLYSRRHTLEGGFRIHNQYHFYPDEQRVYAEREESEHLITLSILIYLCAPMMCLQLLMLLAHCLLKTTIKATP